MYLETESDGDGEWEAGEYGVFRVVYCKEREQLTITLRGHWRVHSGTSENDFHETGWAPRGGVNTQLVVWKDSRGGYAG